MNLLVVMKRNHVLSLESQWKVLMGELRLTVLCSTLNDCLCCFGDKIDINYDNCFLSQTSGILLDQQQLQFIKDVIQARDFMNRCMPRHDAITLISDISSSTSKTA